MAQLSQPTQRLIQRYQSWYQSLQPTEEVPTIHVDEVASKVAAFYEKIRGIIDWKEEHLLKRRAIERILKRRIFSQLDLTDGNFSGSLIAKPLVLELIRGGHFPNDKIEESKIKEVQKAIDKYIFILNHSSSGPEKSKLQLYSWLSGIAACEIEEILSPSLRERALINYMFELMKERIRLNEGVFKIKGVSEKEKNVQVYIAVQRALFKLDAPVISYELLKYRYPEWINLSELQLNNIAKDIYSIRESVEKDLNHLLNDKFYQICERYDTPYLLLGDVLSKEPTGIEEKVSKPEVLETLIREAYNKRVKTLKSRLARAAFYATLSIFLTNIVSLLAIEIPATKILTGQFNFLAVGVDILGPTFLMFLLVVTIKPPKKENQEQVVMEVMKIVHEREKMDVYEIKTFPKRSVILSAIINLFYLLGFCLILALIILGLYQVNFPPLSYVIFVVFLSLIAFAGAKIRQRAKELQVIEEKESFFHFIVDPFAVPVIQLGKWLTVKWKRYNVIAAIFSALIDMPFLVFVEFLEQWRYFLKEKKEKIH
ncbi:hypothetical protein KJA13_02115 [Patescibacteria group bacterium]|nr:hypothetical protein [Patescibacteria group bacterium]